MQYACFAAVLAGRAVEPGRVADQVLEHLEARYPRHLSSQVEVIDVTTPYTWWRYTHNYKGAYQGWLMYSELINARIKKTLPGPGNFYMAGHVAQILRDGKPFSIVAPCSGHFL